MSRDNNWDNFQYPAGCLLSANAKAALIEAAKSRKSDPFRVCKPGRLLECPILVQRKCFYQGLDTKESHKSNLAGAPCL